MAAVHSYAFRTVATLAGGATTPATVITGRVIRPDSVSYTVASGSGTEQFVELGSVAYVRTGHAAWRRVAARPADPLLSLLAVLRAFQPSTMTVAAGGDVLHGRAPLRLVGQVPAGVNGATPVPVEVVISAAGLVTQISVTEPAVAGTRRVTGRSTTSFADFNHVSAITAPR